MKVLQAIGAGIFSVLIWIGIVLFMFFGVICLMIGDLFKKASHSVRDRITGAKYRRHMPHVFEPGYEGRFHAGVAGFDRPRSFDAPYVHNGGALPRYDAQPAASTCRALVPYTGPVVLQFPATVAERARIRHRSTRNPAVIPVGGPKVVQFADYKNRGKRRR